MNEKERLIKTLKGDRVDRPPVICPGGMMSACVTELSQLVPGNHHAEKGAMAEAAHKIFELTGFENYGVPYCLTAEVDPLGAEVNLGDKLVEPRITRYNEEPLEAIMERPVDISTGRMGTVLEVIRELSNDKIPVIGNVSGHISVATSAIDPLLIFKMLRSQPDRIYRFFEFINEYLIRYAQEMIKAGADVISISDPTATGEILGKKNFEKFAVPFYQELIGSLIKQGTPVIIHICGNARNIIESLDTVGAGAVSFDSIVNMKYARENLTTGLMGNINTQLLHTGEQEKIISITRNAIKSGVDIVAPACGLSMATPVANLRAVTDFVKEGHYN